MSKSNEVLLLHVPDAEPWSKYLIDLFGKTKEIRVKSMNLEDLDYENPPEVAFAINDAYLVVILASQDMLTYMMDKSWLSNSLCNVPARTTVVVALCFVDSGEFESRVRDGYKSASQWKHYVMSGEHKQNINSVADMLDIVDKNESTGVKTARPPRKSHRKHHDGKMKVYPTKVHAPHEDVILAFSVEMEGTVQVSFTDALTKYDTQKLNPYTRKFKAPEMSPGKYTLRVYHDAKEMYKTPFYYSAPHEASFTSVEYLCQTFQCDDLPALDRKLVDILERSIPEDDSLSVLYDKVKVPLSSDVRKAKTEYPTMLHFAAASGLSEFCSYLLDVPGSTEAFQIENCDGKDPADLADVYNHPELAQYMRDFMATSYLANACDLYMAMTEGNPDQEGNETESLYMPMGGNPSVTHTEEDEEPESPYSIALPEPVPPLLPRSTKKQLPPVPRQARMMSRKSSDLRLPRGAMGSSSQNELIEIMEGVKEGNFNSNEAVMLFRAWQERNGDGQTRSFKERQKTLKKMRDDYKAMIISVEEKADEMSKTKQGVFSRLVTKKKKPKYVPQISHPVAHRKAPRTSGVPSAIQEDSRISNISTSSSSSRESTSSMSVDACNSSDDSDYENNDNIRVYRRQISSTSSHDGDKRQSRKLDFLAEAEDWEEEQPPLPPRTYTRTDVPRPSPRPRPMQQPRR